MAERPRKAEIQLRGVNAATINVDGHDIAKAVRSLELTAVAGELPWLTLDLTFIEDIAVDGETRIRIPDKTAAALIALGWTPPDGDPV